MERSQELVVKHPYRRIDADGVESNDGRDRKELQITPDKHPLLCTLVSKLRPFQREALEFAVLGRQYQRQFTVKDTDTSTSDDGDGKTAAVSLTDLPEEDHASSLLGIGRILLADEMGLGKTPTSLAIMAYYHAEWPLLVVCPASLRYQWPAEIERFFPSLPPSATYVCTGFQDIGFLKGNQVKQDVKIVVVTYSLFQQRSAVAHAVEAAKFQCVIVDESHNLKQKDSQRTALLLPLLQRAHRLVLLSGTPALARPVELWTSLYALAPKVFGTWSAFTKRYCNVTRKHIGRGRFALDYSGASNVEELNRKLRLIMVRRLKSVVLAELPPKQRTVIQTCVSNDRLKSCKEAIERWQSAPKDDNFEGQAAMMLAYQETGIGKASAVADYVSSVWLPGCQDKILVFAHHTAVLDTIEESLNRNNKAVGHIRIDGSVPASLRAREVRKFQNNTNCRVALLSITAAGVGLTLTAASTVLFAELHWTPGILAQAEDRAHRIGQTASQVHIIYMIDKNKKQSIDSTLWNMLGRKISTVDKVVDGKQDAPYLFAASQQEAPIVDRSQQDQLVEFFAEEAVDRDAKKKKCEVAVKGTIQSFFERAKKTPTPGAAKRKHQDEEMLSFDKKRSVGTLKAAPTASGSSAVSPSPLVKWSCRQCTLDNSVQQNTRGFYRCQVCDEPHAESKSRSTASSLGPVFESVSADSRALSNPPAPSRATANVLSEPNVICLVDGDEIVAEGNRSGRGKDSALTFSVSKNTGRIMIHRQESEAMLFNFDLHDILTSGALDELSETQTHRKRASKEAITDMFDAGKLSKLTCQLKVNGIDEVTPVLEFVRAFLKLGEAEKKFLRDSEQAVTAGEVNGTVARLMLSHSPDDFSRYVGGAKERARENHEKGIASDDDLLVLQGLACAWCGKKLSSVALRGDSTYCNEECAREGRLKRGGMFASSKLRSAAFAIENGKCSLCGIDAHALFRQVCSLRPAERLNKLLSVNWKLPTTAKAMESLLQDPKEGQFWQVDHKKAVAEGGGGCGLDNLRTLCVPCHSSETEKLRGRLKIQHANATSSSGQQQDIRHAFNRRTSS